jgi:hypothetical protein
MKTAKKITKLASIDMRPVTRIPLRMGAFVVSRQADGSFTINGVKESKLVNRHPGVQLQEAPGKPAHFTAGQIDSMVKLMKIA